MMKLTLAAAMFGLASASCPGDTPCSGKGTCGANDKCSCYTGYSGIDCSARTCNYETSWNELSQEAQNSHHTHEQATNKAVKHKYSECSSMGDCDTSSGECSCFDGYEGAGCRRMSCPDNCNRHGTCETLADVALGNSWAAGYTGWDAEKIQRCVCDPGYTGHSCEKRMCMKGDDPMTTGEVNAAYYITVTDECTAEATARTDEVVLKFTDWRGETWYTYPISVNADLTNVVLEEALNALPNRAVEGVTASCDLTANDRCTITFGNRNTGAQNLEVVTTVCNTAGCQPKSKGLSTSSCTVGISTALTGTTEHTECSNRGTCDTDTGLCVCSDGFTGDACQTQTVIL